MALPSGQFRFIFTAKDFAASVAFYRDGLGLSMDHEWNYGPADRGIVFFAAAGMVEFFALAPGADYVQPQGISMLLQVDDVDAWYTLLQQRGLTITQPPTTYPWGHRTMRLLDPDGIVVSLFSPAA